jgi:hypothetical protein
MTIARYDVNNANVNREVRFHVERAAGAVDDTFLAFKGAANVYPFYGQLAGVPTVEQELAQLRLNLVQRALAVYTITVALQVSVSGNAMDWIVEQDEMGAYFNQALPPLGTDPGVDESWPVDTSDDKHHVEDITDRLGTGGMPLGPKTKPGLQSLVNSLATVSYDGGSTGPFGLLSEGGAIILPDGRSVTVTAGSSPATDLPVSGAFVAGLEVTWVNVG